MSKVVSQKWIIEMESLVFQGRTLNEVLNSSASQKELINLLARCEIPFRVIPLGCGVKRITTEVDVCPKCNGTGKC